MYSLICGYSSLPIVIIASGIISLIICAALISWEGFNTDQIFVSEERHMKCGVGRCGHCMIGDKYCCSDGPVFRFDELYGAIDGFEVIKK